MLALTASDLLDVIEQGDDAHPLVRPLVVLAATFPEVGPASLASEPLGVINAHLWEVRAAVVGTDVIGCADCPGCCARVEVEFDGAEATAADRPCRPRPDAPVRPVTPADLFAAAGQADPAAVLASRCAAGLAETDDVSAELAAADPAAELLLELVCPDCGHGWSAPFDVATFLWIELARLAEDVLRDVDLLARTYGWAECEVLAMTPARRRRYVELARDAAGPRT